MLSNGEILQYIITFIILYFIIWFATIKLLYPFWNLQPVLHTYDFVRHIYFIFGGEPFIIWKKNILLSNKFINTIDVKTLLYNKTDETQKKEIITLLRRKYIDSPNVLFNIDELWLDNLVGIGHNQLSFISFTANKKGCCVSYPILISRPNNQTLEAYYLDLFTFEQTTNSGKPTILFETHQYNQNIGNPLHGGNITFFKKEVIGYLGITPFIETNTYLYPILSSRFQSIKGKMLPHTIELLIINKKGDNAYYLMDFIKKYNNNIISVGFSSILNWIKNGYWFVFFMIQYDQILAIYFFRDTQLQYEEYSKIDMNSKCIELINSYNNIGQDNELFYMGFIESVRQLTTKINLDYRLIQIPDISIGNYSILQKWNNKNTTIMKTFLAYYFFNYCWKCDKNNIFILL